MAINIGPRIGIEGEADYRRAIQNIIQETKTLKSEMNALSSEFGKNGATLKQNAQQRKLLTDAIASQKAKLTDLKNMQAQAAAKTGENSTQTLKWKQAVADATAELRNMEKQLKNIPNSLQQIGSKMQDVGKKMQSVGKTLSTYVTLPLAGVGVAGVKAFAEVDKTMVLTNETMGNTAEEAKALSDAMKDAAANSTYGMSDAATATLNFARAGLNATQAAGALAPSMNLAAAEGGNLDTVSAGLVATINGFGGSFDDASKYADVFANACNNSALDIDSLSSSMSVAAPVFSAAGYSINDAALYMGTMANAGIDASTAANSLKTGFARLVSPAKEGKEAMEELGISVTNADGSMKDSVTIQKELHDAFAGLSESEQIAAASAIFGKNQMSNWLALINTAPEKVDALNTSLEETDTVEKQAAAMMSGFGGSLEKLKSSIDVASVSLGEALAPTISLVAEKIQQAVDWFNSLDESQQTMIATVGVAIAALGPVLAIGGTIVSGIGGIVGALGTVISFITVTAIPALGGLVAAIAPVIAAAAPFIAIGAAIVAAGVLIYKNWDKIKEKAAELKKAITEKFGKIKEKVSETWDNVKKKTTETWNNVKAKTSEVWGNVKTTISNALVNAAQAVSSKMSEMKSIYESKGGGIKGAAAVVWNGITTVVKAEFDIMNKLTGGKLGEMASKAKTGITNVKNAITNGLKAAVTMVKTIGGQLITGLWNGINDKVSWIKEKIGGFTQQVLSSIKSFFGIASPSKETKKIGQYLDEGLAEGIKGNTKKVTEAAEKVCDLLLGVYKKVEKTKYSVKDVMGEALVEAGKKRVEELKKNNKLTLQEEINFWKKIVKETKKGSKAYAQASKQQTKAQKSLNKSLETLNSDYIKNLQAISDDLTTSITEINSKLAEDIQSEMDTAKTETQKVWDDLANSIKQRASSLKFGLFEDVSLDEAVDSETLLNRLKKQVTALYSYEQEMAKLKNRVGDSDLYEEVAAQGPKALNQIKALNNLSDAQLAEYKKYYEARDVITQREATKELARQASEAQDEIAQINANSQEKIKALKEAAAAEKETVLHEARVQARELNKQYKSDLAELGVNLKNSGKEVGESLMKSITDGMKDANISSDLQDIADSLVSQIKTKFKLDDTTTKTTKQTKETKSLVNSALNTLAKATTPLLYSQGANTVNNTTTTTYGNNYITVNAAAGQNENEIANMVMKKMQGQVEQQRRGAM